MKTSYCLIFLNFLFCLLWGCQPGLGYKGEVIKISPNKAADQIEVSELFNVEAYIPLKGTGDHFIASINKIVVHENWFYILDDVTQSIFRFSRNGDFDFRISSPGKGAGEYFLITDFSVMDQTLYVFDAFSRKVIDFCSVTGTFLKEYHFPFFAKHKQVISPDSILLFSDFTPNLNDNVSVGFYNLFLVGFDSGLHNAFLPFSKDVDASSLISKNRNIYPFESKIFAWQNFDDNIYVFDSLGFRAAFRFDFGNQNSKKGETLLSIAQEGKLNVFSLQQKAQEMGYFELLDFAANKNHMAFTLKQGDNLFFGFYCQKRGKEKLFKATVENGEPRLPFINNLDGVEYYPLVTSYKNLFVSYAFPFQFDEIVLKGAFLSDKDSSEKRDVENPILILLSLKPFE